MANYEKRVEQEAAYPIPISLYNCYRTVRHEKRYQEYIAMPLFSCLTVLSLSGVYTLMSLLFKGTKAEWLEDIRKGSCSLKSFLGVAGEGIDEREPGKFEEGLNSKVKLSLYRTFGKIVEFKKYLRGVGDAGTRLLFKFRSGTHGLNEELGRHRGREGRKECLLCDAECESVSHVLWDCPAYVSIRSAFMLELRRELGDRFEHFQSLDSFEKSSYVLGSEAWEEYSSGLLGLIKDFVLSVWEERKVRLYGEHANVHQSHSQNDSGDLRGVAGGDGELGCLCGKAGTSHLCDGSAHSSGCVVNGSNAMAAV